MADFGNPLVLAGNFEVLSTKVFFAVVGASHDQSRAAVLALVLLVFTLLAFWAQQRWLGRASYTTVTGKGDAGLPVPLPRGLRWLCYGIAIPWAALTFVIYVTIFVGGFVKSVGRDYSFTLDHFLAGFAGRDGAARPAFHRRRLASLSTTLIIARRRAAHRGHGPAHRLAAVAPELRRQARLRVRHAAELRHPRHRGRHQLHPRVQRAAVRAHRHRRRSW